MSFPVLNNLDMNGFQVLNQRLHMLAADPSALEAKIFYNSTTKKVRYHNGTDWVDIATGDSAITDHGALTGLGDDDHSQYVHNTLVRTITAVHTFNPSSATAPFTLGANAAGQLVTGLNADQLDGQHASDFALSGHTHTASQVTDFNTAVRANRLDQMAAPTAAVAMNGQKITGLAEPTTSSDAATKSYVDTAVQGLDIKASVKAATTTNITLSGTQTIDGVTLVANDRVLVKNQATQTQNGIYVVAAGAWSRSTDADTNADLTPGAYVFVEQGTVNGDTGWVLSSDSVNIGTTNIVWTQFSQAGTVSASNVGGAFGLFKQKNGTTLEFHTLGNTGAISLGMSGDVIEIGFSPSAVAINDLSGTLGIAKGGTGATTAAAARTALAATGKYSTTIGDGSATSFVVTHNLGTQDVVVFVRQAGSPYAQVITDVEVTNTTQVTIKFGSAPATNAYRVTVIG